MFRKRKGSGFARGGAWCAALTLGLSLNSALGGIGDTIEIDGNMKDEAGGGVDWCCLVDCHENGNCACLGTVGVEIFEGVLGDCADSTKCEETVDCGGTMGDRFYTGGGSKDKEAISCDLGAEKCWQHEIDGGGPNDKTNIMNGLIALLIDPTNGHQILAFAGDLKAENGTAEIGVWLLANDNVGLVCDDSGLWTGQHHPDDVQILATFTRGGREGTVRYRTINSVLADGKIQFDDDDGVIPPASIAAAAINQGVEIPASDTCWTYQNKFGSVPLNVHPSTTFFSAAIDLTEAGLARCFNRFVLQTRTSHSTTATYKDFITGEFDTCRDLSGQKLEVDSVECGEDPAGQDCDAVVGPLQGWEICLYEDLNGNNQPDAGELVTVDGNGNPLAGCMLTDSSGSFAFHNIPNGDRSYILCETIPPTPGENFTWEHCFPDDGGFEGGGQFCYSAFNLPADRSDLDFRNFQQRICATISGTKYCDENGDGSNAADPDDPGLEGFCITLEEADGTRYCDITGIGGAYEFPDVDSGQTITVCEDLDGSDCEALGCGSADNSAVWVASTAVCDNVAIPAGATAFSGPSFGNASRPSIDCNVTDPVQLNTSTTTGDCEANFCFTPTATNLCGDVTVVCEASGGVTLTRNGDQWCGDFPAGCPGVTTVTCTATTEATGNIPSLTTSCSFDVEVTDDENPDATCGADDVFECPHVITFDDCQFSDNCPFFPASSIASLPATCPDVAVQRQTCSVDDECGNHDECTQTIRVQDTTPPTIDQPTDKFFECPGTPSFDPPGCNDACGGCSVSMTSNTSTGTCPVVHTRCWQATDDCGLTSPVVCQNIEERDTTRPTITDPTDRTIECPATPVFEPPTCSDACGGCNVSITRTTSSGTCPEVHTRCWVATDDCGNVSREVCQDITIEDTTRPSITAPLNKALECFEAVSFDPPSCSDACGGCNVTQTADSVSNSCPNLHVRCWQATDDCGNVSAEVCQTITEPCCGCRVTGGGVDCDGEVWHGNEDCNGALGQMKKVQGTDVYTFGGQAGSPTAAQPQPWGEWTHRQHDGPSGRWTFHAGTASAPPGTEIDLIDCCDPGFCNPARPAPFKQIDFVGVGSFKNVIDPGDIGADDTLRWFEVHIEDLGEPGRNGTQRNPPGFCPLEGYSCAEGDCRCPDFYHITIHATESPASAVVYDVYGYITGGNLQLHPPVGQ